MSPVNTEPVDPAEFTKLCAQLEEQELESPGGVATADVYTQLLALYLLQNDLPNSRYLWKRIPGSIKGASPELAQVWDVGQKMWQRDLPAIYTALNKEWPDNIKAIMASIREQTRKRAVRLVQQAYSSISAEDLASILGMSVNEAVDAAVREGWSADPATRLVTPRPIERPAEGDVPSQQQLSRLTDFVAFLEN